MTYIFNDMAMVTDEEPSATIRHIDLHTDQTIGVSWQVMQCYTLTEIKGLLIKGLPIATKVSG
jgi:hypothetical protein